MQELTSRFDFEFVCEVTELDGIENVDTFSLRFMRWPGYWATHGTILLKIVFLISSILSVFTRRHGGHVGVQENSEKNSFGNMMLLLCKTLATFCQCLKHQHGRLITWVKTKNVHFLLLLKYKRLVRESWE